MVAFGMIGASISGVTFVFRAWHGDENRYDLHADLFGFHLRLFCCGIHIAASLLQDEPHIHLYLSA
jgi:hypothetical protein